MQKREIELKDDLRFFQILPKRPEPRFAMDLSISGCNIFLLFTYERANAIAGIDLDFETVGGKGSMLMVVASGTAVRV